MTLKPGFIGHQRSFKLVPCENLGVVSYSPSMVTVALSYINSEIEILVKNCDFLYPFAFDTPIRGSLSEYCHDIWYGKTRVVWLSNGEKSLRIQLLISTKFMIVTDRQTDRRTLHNS